jgi:dihydrofolate reductase
MTGFIVSEDIDMRKVVMLNRISLDGFFADVNGNTHNWFVDDSEVDKAAHEMMRPDTLLLGRVTYEIFHSHWPKVGKDPNASERERNVSKELDEMTKIVFSKTLQEVTWENSKLVKGDVIGEVRKLKEGNGPDITIFGSGSIIRQLTNERLIDEYLVVVTPIVLGAGKPLFKDVQTLNLDLVETRDFESGNVVHHYQLAAK